MVTYEEQDAEYLAWLADFPNGYVVNSDRRPRSSYLVLHRATCTHITQLKGSAGHWTFDYAKQCSANVADLHSWAKGIGGSLALCKTCKP